jgi:glycosyltransferase involved in cell wall biosynthesis
MRILLITYYFPPLGGAGVQRTLKFVKYLSEFGITPIVISAKEPGYPIDESLLCEVQHEIEVHRLHHTPLLTRATRIARTLLGTKKSFNEVLIQSTSTVKSKWRDRMLRAYTMGQFPDDKTGWGRQAYAKGKSILNRGNIDLILSSSPPITAHVVAARLKHRFGIPWVADFRDLWTGNPSYDVPSWRNWIDRKLERKLLANADGVTAVTREMVKLLEQDMLAESQAIFLPNGYDEADFAGLVLTPTNKDRFVMLYTGSLYGHQSPEGILNSVRTLLQLRPDFADKLCLRFIGNIGSRFEPVFATFERDFPGIVERNAYVPHKEIPAALVNADALLLLIGGGNSARGVLTGKVFEYLRAGRPILLLGPKDGEAERIVEDSGWGVVHEENDIENIADTLEQWLAGTLPQGLSAQNTIVKQFERRALTGQLAQFLRQIQRGVNV